MEITIGFQSEEFARRMEFASRELLQAVRAGVNKTAVEAKRAFVRAVPPDAAGPGISQARVRKQLTNIRRASPWNLRAEFDASGKGWGSSPKVLSAVWGNQHKSGNVVMTTFSQTGGGSVGLSSSKFFVLRANGGTVILERKGSARGLGKAGRSLKAIYVKRIYAENPRTALAQENAAPRRTWEQSARTLITSNIGAALQTVLDGSSVGDATGGAE